MKPTASLNPSCIHEAATAANDTYSPLRAKLFSEIRTVRQFRIVGDLIACTRIDETQKTAYVAIRGTSEIGNWVFTNFQAFFTPLYVVDDSIDCNCQEYQGGKLRSPISGKMHQGFIRAFSWLWYGTEPVFNLREFSRGAALRQLLKYLLVFGGPMAIWLLIHLLFPPFGTLTQALSVSLFVGFLVSCLENGIVEDYFLKTEPPSGKKLSILVRELNKYDKVIFTGHSLGGAVASVAFAVYRTWCKSESSRRDNGHLVTFGSARLGDEMFVNSFEEQHGSRILHIQHPGDPVPQLPPNGLYELLARRFPLRGLGGLLLSLAFLPWTVYKYTWHVPRPARWSTNIVDHMDEPPFRRICISFHSMTRYKNYTRKLLDEHSDA